MNLHIPRQAHWPLLAAGVSLGVAVLVVAAEEPMTQWLQASYRDFAGAAAAQTDSDDASAQPSLLRSNAPSKGKCMECGFIESARLAESGVYEITVRLADRTKRVFRDSDASKWRPGERIVHIGGGSPPGR